MSTRHRLNLAVTTKVKERLNRLMETTDAESVSEVIRRALIIYEDLISFESDGGRVVLQDKDGQGYGLRLRSVGASMTFPSVPTEHGPGIRAHDGKTFDVHDT